MQKRKRSLQPFMIVVGETLSSITNAYVCVDKNFYKLPSTIEALDVLFKVFYVLDTFYPPESSHLWSIIQEFLYGIKPQHGERSETRTAEVILALTKKREAQSHQNVDDNDQDSSRSADSLPQDRVDNTGEFLLSKII